MKSPDLLFELLTEELPPRTLLSLSDALCAGVAKGIDDAGVPHGAVHGFATPRRLAVWIEQLAERQPDRPMMRRGPPVANAFDAQGTPTQAAVAFAKSCGVEVQELARLTNDKGAWLQFRGIELGAETTSLLGSIVIQAVAGLPIAKRMRWGTHRAEFERPVHAVVLLYGDRVVNVDLLGLTSGRLTSGHRFHAPKPIALKSARDYSSRLHRAKVVVDFTARRELIRAGVAAKAVEAGGVALMEDALLNEVTALVEWPVPLLGQFEERFLSLPREVVIATIQEHQRYFAVQAPDGKLSRWFVTVSNIDSKDPSVVREGNERVVRPRLSDATFFWEQDVKIPLQEQAGKLAGVTFQARLGSYADKTARVGMLAKFIGERIGAGMGVSRAAELCKADLMTLMVGEFPELQGTMGRYYAAAQGEAADVSLAIEEHYKPRFAGDSIPTGKIAQALALADKLDTLTGIFTIELRPTGTKDPFGLRRAALGVLRILLDAGLDLDLFDCLAVAAAAQPVQRMAVIDEVYDFILERLRGVLAEQPGNTLEMLDAVLVTRPRSPLDATLRLAALREFLRVPQASVLAAINKRIANLLKKTQVNGDWPLVREKLTEAAERALHDALVNLQGPVREAIEQRHYAQGLHELLALQTPVDEFFERVMVMDDDMERRNSRLALLHRVQMLLGGIADLSRLPG